MGEMAPPDATTNERSWVTPLLGVNLWVMLVGAPALHAAGAGEAGSQLPVAVLAQAFLPLTILWLAVRRPSPLLLRFVYPASLLIPLLLHRPLMAERTLGPAGVVAVLVGLAAWFLAAGGVEPSTQRPRGGAVRAGIALGALFISGAYLVHFDASVVGWVDRIWPGRAAEARVLLSLVAFIGWMAAAAVALKILAPSGAAIVASLLLLACNDGGTRRGVGGPSAGMQGPDVGERVVAEVNGRQISLSALRFAVQAEGADADVRQVLDRLVTQELLLERAEEAGLGADSESWTLARRRAVQRLIEEEFEARHKVEDLPAKVVRSAYDRNEGIFNQPDLMEMIHAVALVKKDAPEDAQAAAKKLCEEVRDRVLQLPAQERTIERLTEIVAPFKESGAEIDAQDLGWQAESSALVKAFVEAAFKLKEEGEVSPVVHTKFGYHLIVRRGWKDKVSRGLDEVREELVQKLYPEWRQQRFQLWLTEMDKAAGTERWPKVVSALQE